LILVQIGTPARGAKVRGKSPGWRQGRVRRRKKRHRVVNEDDFVYQTA